MVQHHNDFRLTMPHGTPGKRVKRRLLWIAVTAHALAIVVFFCCWVSPVWWIDRLNDRWAHPVPLLVGYFAVPVLAYIGVLWSVSKIAVWLGWMSSLEASELPLSGRRWRDSWLEPIDPKSVVKHGTETKKSGPAQSPNRLRFRGVGLVRIALWVHLVCVVAAAAISLTDSHTMALGRWNILLAPVFMSATCALVICPLFVLLAIARSGASPGQRLVVLMLEAFLIGLQLFAFLPEVQ